MLSDLTDPRSLSDDDLDQLRRDVITEQERREKVKSLPDQLGAMARTAAEAGCDPAVLRASVDEALDGGAG